MQAPSTRCILNATVKYTEADMQTKYNSGAYTTMITPYRADGNVDIETARRYVEWYYENGCDGIFAVCQSSEIFYLSVHERVALNKAVYDKVKSLEKIGGRRMTVVSSGHVADSLSEQARELSLIAESGTDALILITNRLDPKCEGDDTWIRNAEALLRELPQGIELGLYECPYPYKRLLTPRILKWCLEVGRFRFIKDTCCDSEIIRRRLDLLRGSELKLLNANCQTLLQSLKDGAAGYCGIMCNYHPRLYSWLCENYESEPEKAELVQAFMCMSGFTESALPYPLTAKYHMCLEGIETVNFARNRNAEELDDYAKDCMRQMKLLSDSIMRDIIRSK